MYYKINTNLYIDMRVQQSERSFYKSIKQLTGKSVWPRIQLDLGLKYERMSLTGALR